MDLRTALKEQYHAGLAMLTECVELCPEDLWTAGTHPRTFWRIAFHTAFFTHNYLVQDEAAFKEAFVIGHTPSAVVNALGAERWTQCGEVEPYELPEGAPTVSKEDLLEYFAFIRALIDPTIDALELETEYSGFSWYEDISKLSHELMNLRHIQGHVGQLSELLMMRGIDIKWVHRGTSS